MENLEKINKFLTDKGYKTKKIESSKVLIDLSLLEYCKQNVCQRYNTNYSCSPNVDYNAYIERINKSTNVLVIAKEVVLEELDGKVDYKSEENLLRQLNSKIIFTKDLYDLIDEFKISNLNLIGCSPCIKCDKCNYPNPCRFPNYVIPSMSAIGINVLKLAESCNMLYNNSNSFNYYAMLIIAD